MSYACKPFGYEEDEGMRIFCIVEMFLAAYHIITASYVYRVMVETLYLQPDYGAYGSKMRAFMLSIGILFMLTLVAQAVSGFLLYLIGWKQRHLIICYIWIALGCTNNLFSIIILITEIAHQNQYVNFWTRFLLYLFYVFYGTWVIVDFIKWARENHLAAGECACLEKRRVAPVVNRSRAKGGVTTTTSSTTPSGHHHSTRHSTAGEDPSAAGHKKPSDDATTAHVQIKEAPKKEKEPVTSNRRGSGASEAKSGISRASRRR